MRYLLMILLALTIQNLKGQTSQSIDFETKLTWQQIKEKARKENKYVFIDIYTTWCVPCKEMAINVFTEKKVAEFFNKNFINVALQMDSTKHDDLHTKNWRHQADLFAKTYHINSYPTYIFLNPQGYYIHYISGSSSADEFLAKAKMALDPNTQLINLKRGFNSGRRDSLFLLSLINTAKMSGDLDSIGIYINNYLAISKKWNTRRNLEFIVTGTKGSTDLAFRYLLSHQHLIDSILGQHTYLRTVKNIAYDEVVFPLTRKNAKKQVFGGGMIIYSGEVIRNVNWDAIKIKLDSNFAAISDEVLLFSKPQYYEAIADWKAYCKSVDSYINNTKDLDLYQLDNYARIILMSGGSAEQIRSAISWCELILSRADSRKTPIFLKAYSSLLYKDGQKDGAIKSLEKYLSLISSPDSEAEKELGIMKSAN